MARLGYADPADLPPGKRDLLGTISEAPDDGDRVHSLRVDTLNVYRLLGRNPALLEAFREYASLLWEASGLTPYQREVVILATACHAGSGYEWHQHVRVALDEGMAPDQLLAISKGEPDRLDPDLAALARYVERFVDGRVDDEVHGMLAAHLYERAVLGVGMLSACYLGLARLLQALDVDLEAEFVGWELEHL